jgi:predicted DNA-binding transcriptional regulator YafY
MNIRIHTFLDPLFHGDDTRGAAVWAIAIGEGGKIEDGALASGSDDRSASNAALAAFWKREDAKAQATQERSVFDSTTDLSYSGLSNVKTTLGGVGDLLRGAIEADPRETVRINYTDARDSFTSRLIVPSQIDGGLILAYDIGADDARTFRLDRISSAEVVR